MYDNDSTISGSTPRLGSFDFASLLNTGLDAAAKVRAANLQYKQAKAAITAKPAPAPSPVVRVVQATSPQVAPGFRINLPLLAVGGAAILAAVVLMRRKR